MLETLTIVLPSIRKLSPTLILCQGHFDFLPDSLRPGIGMFLSMFMIPFPVRFSVSYPLMKADFKNYLRNSGANKKPRPKPAKASSAAQCGISGLQERCLRCLTSDALGCRRKVIRVYLAGREVDSGIVRGDGNGP